MLTILHKNGLSATVILLSLMALGLSGCSASIHDAIAHESTDAVLDLLQAHPEYLKSVDGKGKSPLHTAVTYKKIELLPILVEKGIPLDVRDVTGMTPLHVAAMLGRSEEAKALLELGADPSLVDDYGDMPLHTAAVFGSGGIIQLLVRQGQAPDQPNAEGQTGIEIAREYRHDRVIALFEKLAKSRK
ncbi:MAG: ankyrin repeat domain-containing protein [Candidatus Hydrogenedens sp.]|nr:ankyrin repeat domain-containing protein [Candidatus Hydrogenedens sp.]